MTMIMNLKKTSEEVQIRARHVIICDNYPKKHRPSLCQLRRRLRLFVRRPHLYYYAIRLLHSVHLYFGLPPFFRGPGTTPGQNEALPSPDDGRTYVSELL